MLSRFGSMIDGSGSNAGGSNGTYAKTNGRSGVYVYVYVCVCIAPLFLFFGHDSFFPSFLAFKRTSQCSRNGMSMSALARLPPSFFVNNR